MEHTPYNLRDIESILKNADALELSRPARLRLLWLLFAATHDWNVSKTCRHFGIARTTFVRWIGRFDPENPQSLEEHSRRPRTARKSNDDPIVVAFIERCRRDCPYINKETIRDRLQEECGVRVSVSTVGRIIQRHGLFFGSTPAHRAKRVHAENGRAAEHPSISPRSDLPPSEEDLPPFDLPPFCHS